MKRFLCFSLSILFIISALCGCSKTDEYDNPPSPDNTASTGKRSLQEFSNATLGVIDGSLYDGYSRTLFPNAKIDSYPSFTDLFQCVKQGKIDGFLMDIPNFSAVQRTDTNLSYITVPGYAVEIGTAFGKNERGELLKSQMNEFLDRINADGTKDTLWEKWCGKTEPQDVIQVPDYSPDAQELMIALDLSRKPFVYLLNGEFAGFEVELIYLFCLEYGYRPTFEIAQWTAGVAGLQQEKYDILSCGIYMTDERRESVNFSDPYSVADVIMVIYNQPDTQESFWNSVKDGFEKTFLREQRWKLILDGVVTTLIISFFSVIGGSLFGFLLYMLSRSQSSAVASITKQMAKIYSRLIAGTPTLVVLMILFYIIFPDMNGVVVAILGFLLTFGSFVYSHLSVTVESVDHGQTEAAYALGYSRNRAFFRIVLPQALRLFLPTFAAEAIGLIKATAVVGYIAVNDLTKMGDIIRSNTYEPFFPLIAIAVIYFLLTWGAARLLSLLQQHFNPKERKSFDLLKGVER